MAGLIGQTFVRDGGDIAFELGGGRPELEEGGTVRNGGFHTVRYGV